jgi:hypothetical protein
MNRAPAIRAQLKPNNVALRKSAWLITVLHPRFYEPDLGSEPDSPFARDAQNKLVRRSYRLDMNDRSLVLVMTQGIGAHLTNDEKRAHLIDLKREHLIDQVCIQKILPPAKR